MQHPHHQIGSRTSVGPFLTGNPADVSEWHNKPPAPLGNDRMIIASIRFSNAVIQENTVQQPIQQRRRTSAINSNTLRTEKSHFKHKMDKSEHQRTTHVESPLRHFLFFAVHRCIPAAPEANQLSTAIHGNPLLSTGFAVSFAVKGD